MRRRLTVVVAGPGFGKSTLLGGWAARVTSAWYTAGPADTRALRFAQGLAEALSLEVSLEARARPDALVLRLLEPLESRPDGLLLVVDDAHELGATAFDVLRGLIQQAPPQIRLAVGSRTELPFSIERLRGQGYVVSIDAAQLRFSLEEVEEFIGATLGGGELAASVYELTEGWPAAVRLTVESLRPIPPERRPALVARAAQPGGSLFGYLTHEVLRAEPPEVGELLAALAPLDGFTYALCAHLGFAGAEERLEALGHRGLFLDAHGGEQGWMRLHALVREAVLAGLDHGQVEATRRAAAGWLETRGLHEEALRAWTRIGDAEADARVIRTSGHRMIELQAYEALVEAGGLLPSSFDEAEVEELVGDAHHTLGDDEAHVGGSSALGTTEGPAVSGSGLGSSIRTGRAKRSPRGIWTMSRPRRRTPARC